MEPEQRTEINALGEFRLIERLTANTAVHQNSTVKGIGDDAAVIAVGERYLVVTTDLLVEHVHFDMMYTPLKHLGYKAVVVNLSDVAAMNATPKQITVSLAVSNRFSVEALEAIYEGINLACANYKVDLVGGDTSSSSSGLVISVTAIGEARKEDIVFRNTAQEKDLICVTGDLGAAYIGLQILEREKRIFQENDKIQPDLEGHDYVLERQLKPEARVDVIEKLKELDIKPTAMLDISDGLASELKHLCTQSDVGAHIYEHKLPVDEMTASRAEDFNLDPSICALNGGEDYELLFTIRPTDYPKIQQDENISVIGHVTDAASGLQLIYQSGTMIPIKAQGWDAFGGQES